MKNKFLIFMATITFFLTVAVVGILLKPELYESKTTVIKENDSMQSEVDEKNIESEVSNQEEWGSGDVYDGSSPIIRKMGEKLSVIKLPYPLIYMDKEKEIDRNMPYKIAVTKYPSRKYIQFG